MQILSDHIYFGICTSVVEDTYKVLQTHFLLLKFISKKLLTAFLVPQMYNVTSTYKVEFSSYNLYLKYLNVILDIL